MNTLVRMLFGSHVYGCNTPTSDTDYKGVFIPNMDDVLLGRQPKTSVVKSTGEQNSKNTAEDVDDEMFTLHGFLRMVAEGQVVALDMLFTPDEFIIEQIPLWKDLQIFAKENLLSKNTTAYIGYCRKQAAKYGIKGSRVADVRALLDLLSTFEDKSAKLFEHYETIEKFCVDKEFTQIITNEVETRNIGGGGTKNIFADKLLECCQRKAPMTIKVKDAIEIYQKVFDNYGARAKMAEENEGVDWKAMHHALRCCYEAVELLDTGRITFPLKNKDYLLEVKQGKLEYPVVAEHLENMMEEVERAKERSQLPDEPNWKALDNYVISTYTKQIKGT